MAQINTQNNTTSVYERINQRNQDASTVKSASKSESDSQMFMKLMIAQLQNQDPTSPADTTDFMQQISSMSTVESINNLNQTVTQMSNALMTSQAALQASSMVGREVFIKTDQVQMAQDGQIDGLLALPASASDVRVSVLNSAGEKVQSWSLGAKGPGEHNFSWSGQGYPAGNYKVLVEATDTDGQYKTVESFLGQTVNSVSLGQNGVGMKVNTDAGSVELSDIRQIG